MNINKQLKTMITAAGMVLLTGLTGISGSVMASTPDGETPANEGVCDGLQGGIPGLYGLCVAYCEAQDLDTFDKKPPSIKILENYNKKLAKAGATEPTMPCLNIAVAECPCWSLDELASISDGGDATCAVTTNMITITDTTVVTPNALHFADIDTGVGRERCRYIDLNLIPPVVRSFTVSPAEAQDCYSAIEQACP